MKFEADLTERLRDAADRVPAGDPPIERIVHRGRRRRVARSVAIVATVALLGALLPAGLIGLSRIGRSPASERHSVVRIDVGGRPIRRPVVAYGAFWSIVEKMRGPLALVRIDARTLRATTLKLASAPESVAAGFGSIWVACADGAVRILDPSTGLATGSIQVAESHTIRSDFSFITAGEHAVWTTTTTAAPGSRLARTTLFRIDPATKRASDRASILSLCCTTDLAAGEGAVWSLVDERLVRFDPGTAEVTTLPVSGGQLLAVGNGAVWVTTADGSVQRIDPRSDAVVASIPGVGHGRPAVGSGFIWLGAHPPPLSPVFKIEVYRINTSNAVDSRSVSVRAGRARFADLSLFTQGYPPVEVAVGEGAVWATDEDAFQVIRIDLRSFAPHPSPSTPAMAITRIDLGGIPIRKPVATQGALWTIVQSQSDGTLHLVRVDARTGTVRRISFGRARPEYLAAGFGSVWVAGCPPEKGSGGCRYLGTLYRVDPTTMTISGHVELGGALSWVAAGAGAIWVASPVIPISPKGLPANTLVFGSQELSSIYQIDPETLAPRFYYLHALQQNSTTNCCIQSLAAGDTAVWMVYNGQLVRMDPVSGALKTLEAYGSDVVAGEGEVWMEGHVSPKEPPTLETTLRIDPATNRVIPVGPAASWVLAGNGAVWVLQASRNFSNRTLTLRRLDPVTGEQMGRPIAVEAGQPNVSGFGPVYFSAFVHAAYADGVLWVTVGDSFEAIRISPA